MFFGALVATCLALLVVVGVRLDGWTLGIVVAMLWSASQAADAYRTSDDDWASRIACRLNAGRLTASASWSGRRLPQPGRFAKVVSETWRRDNGLDLYI